MSVYVALTRGGQPWEPLYVEAVNHEKCIGCGRCYKVCGMDVLSIMGVTEDGELVAVAEDDDDDDGEIDRKVMTVKYPENCIGCRACSKVCTKGAQTHVTAQVMLA
ncbi:MAG: ferredoxin III, nif-specific [Alphaproteobacteria bacterium]|nr:ferredoxin III, nif-specific [Alphaproteobacteria bacterium]